MHNSAPIQTRSAIAVAITVTVVTALLAFSVQANAATKVTPPPAPAVEPQAAPVPPPPTTTLDRIKTTGTIKLGYRADAAPMSSRDASGQPTGYSVALCGKVADALKRNLSLPSLAVEWVVVGADLSELDAHGVDLVCAANEVTLANREKASFSIPIFPGGVSALLRNDAAQSLQRALEERPPAYSPLWRGTPPATLDHRTYSALVSSTTLDTLRSQIVKMRLTANVEPVDTYDAGLAAVVSGRTDVLFGDRAQLLQALQRNAAKKDLHVLSRHYMFAAQGLALSRNDDAFRLEVDRALTNVYAEPQFGDLYAAAFGPADADTVAFFRSVAVPK